MNVTNKLEESYCRHILIAIEAGDVGAPFRTLFDYWFAYRTGGPFLNSNSRPQWLNHPSPDKYGEALRRAHFISSGAARTMAGIEHNRLMKDHAIPVSTLRNMLFDTRLKSVEQVRAFMERHYRIGVITKAEDDAICAVGLRSCMPEHWSSGDSPFVRYAASGIESQDVTSEPQVLIPSKEVTRTNIANVTSRLLGKAHSGLVWKGKFHG